MEVTDGGRVETSWLAQGKRVWLITRRSLDQNQHQLREARKASQNRRSSVVERTALNRVVGGSRPLAGICSVMFPNSNNFHPYKGRCRGIETHPELRFR